MVITSETANEVTGTFSAETSGFGTLATDCDAMFCDASVSTGGYACVGGSD